MWTQTNSSLYGIVSVRSNNNKNEEKNIQHNEIFLVSECGCTCLDIKTFKYVLYKYMLHYKCVFMKKYSMKHIFVVSIECLSLIFALKHVKWNIIYTSLKKNNKYIIQVLIFHNFYVWYGRIFFLVFWLIYDNDESKLGFGWFDEPFQSFIGSWHMK